MKFFKFCSLQPIFGLLYLILLSQLQVQEAADCLGADCVPRYVEMKRLIELEIEDAFQAKQKVRLLPIPMIFLSVTYFCYRFDYLKIFNLALTSP